MFVFDEIRKSKKVRNLAIAVALAAGMGITILINQPSKITSSKDQVRTSITYAIGDTGPAGGKIFIIPSTPGNTTGKYFEAAPADIPDHIVFCQDTSIISVTTGNAIGTGTLNTAAMLGKCTTDAPYQAANYKVANGSKTYSDWFLPAKDELNLLYLNRTSIGGLSNGIYWSSSQGQSAQEVWMWSQDFINGNQMAAYDGNPDYLRPIRTFN